jgi:hypothetical protein
MDLLKIKELIQRNSLAEEMFKHFKSRDRNPKDGVMSLHHTKQDLRKKGVQVLPDEFIANFRVMHAAGLGKLEPSFKKPERFVWKVLMKDVAGDVIGESYEEPPTTKTPPKATASKPFTDLAIEIMKADLSEKEAKVLIAALEAKLQ